MEGERHSVLFAQELVSTGGFRWVAPCQSKIYEHKGGIMCCSLGPHPSKRLKDPLWHPGGGRGRLNGG